jgi:ssDNA-binding Zn-finger/Zn-ribbon topoisomerase 1
MKDIKLLEVCDKCREHLTLMESQRVEDGTLWAVKRCLNCGGHPVEEVIRLISEIEQNALEKQIPMQATYVYDDEFICPACSYEDDGYDVKTLKVCPECGQRLKWD